MAATQQENEFVAYLLDLLQIIGPVTARSMFGGHGIFLDKRMFGLVAESVLYLKANEKTIPDFEEKGLEAFYYEKNQKTYKMSYFQAPEDILEDPKTLQQWALKAYDVALEATSKSGK